MFNTIQLDSMKAIAIRGKSNFYYINKLEEIEICKIEFKHERDNDIWLLIYKSSILICCKIKIYLYSLDFLIFYLFILIKMKFSFSTRLITIKNITCF